MHKLLAREVLDTEQVEVSIPQTVVLASDVFDDFLEENRLRGIALFLLGDGFLVVLFLVTLLGVAFVSSVTIMAAGAPVGADVRVAPEGRSLPAAASPRPR